MSVWPAIDRVPMHGIIFEALARQLPNDPDLKGGLKLSNASRLHELFATAGFRDVRVTPDIRRIVFDLFDDYWEPFEGGPGRVGQIYRRLPHEARCAVV